LNNECKFEMQKWDLKNKEVLIIREANIFDAQNILNYLNCVAGESDNLTFGLNEFGCSILEEEAIIEDYQAHDNALYLIGVIDRKIVSILTFSGGMRARTKHAGELGISVLSEKCQLGVGTHMMQTMIHWAMDTGIVTKINLKVVKDNEMAIHLYKKFGFKVEGINTRSMKIDGVYVDCIFMGLEL